MTNWDLFTLSVGSCAIGLYRAGNPSGWRAPMVSRTYLGRPFMVTVKAGPVVFCLKWRRSS